MTAQRVALWAKKARDATERRDAEIRLMRLNGATLRDVGTAAGLSHTAIAKILARSSSNDAP